MHSILTALTLTASWLAIANASSPPDRADEQQVLGDLGRPATTLTTTIHTTRYAFEIVTVTRTLPVAVPTGPATSFGRVAWDDSMWGGSDGDEAENCMRCSERFRCEDGKPDRYVLIRSVANYRACLAAG